MGKVLKADNSTDLAYVEYDLPSNQAEVWATWKLAFDDAARAFWLAVASNDFVDFVGNPDGIEIGIVNLFSGGQWQIADGSSSATPVPVANTWITCELRVFDNGFNGTYWETLNEFYIDGSLVVSGTYLAVNHNQTRTLYFGSANGSVFDPASIAYIDDVKLGTTRGASDLFSDDFEDGTLDAWSSTFGDVSIVDDPFGPPPPPPKRYYVVEHFDHDDDIFQTVFPENLNFQMNIRDPHSINYELSFGAKALGGDDVVFEHDFIRPRLTGWRLKYIDDADINVTICEGVHTLCNTKAGDDFMKVGGASYLEYLDHVIYPFNPSSPNDYRMKSDGTAADPDDYTGDNPPRGYSYKTNKDVAQIINDLFTMCFAVSNRWPVITCALDDFGYTAKFELALGDNTTLLQIIKQLSDQDPGFDYQVSNDREFKAWTPFRFGDSTIASTPEDPNIVHTFDTDHSGIELEFTVTGPKYTHLLGLATAPKSRLGKALGSPEAEPPYGRLDGAEDYGEVVDQDEVDSKTAMGLKFWQNPVHEIPLTAHVEEAQKEFTYPLTFWDTFRAGLAIWLLWDLIYHQIDSAQRIISMDCTVDENGNGEVAFGLNQIYDLTELTGEEEG